MQRTFDAIVIDARLTEAKTGTHQVMLTFRLDDGSRLTRYLPLTDRALKYTVADLRTCGWTGDDLDDLSSIGGAAIELVVDDEEFNGVTRTKIKFINAAGGKDRAPPPIGVGAAWRARIAALASGGTPNGQEPDEFDRVIAARKA